VSSAAKSENFLARSLRHQGRNVITFVREAGGAATLAWRSTVVLFTKRFEPRAFIYQLESLGVKSLGIALATAVFVGIVMTIQFAYSLERYGAQNSVGRVVGLSMVRELAPSLTALVVGCRIGAGIAAELGSMAVTEQIDAIRALGADPVQKLVMPRVIALTLGLPLLTFFAILLGVAGGMLVADLQYAIGPNFYLQTVTTTVTVGDFVSGVSKTFVFGWIVAMVGCHVGLRTAGGTRGVGQATTRAVVTASIAILVSDFFLTKLLLLFPDMSEILAWARGVS